MPADKPLQGQTMFITGGNSGIGLTTALYFAERGCDIAIVGRNPDKNTSAQRQIEAKKVKCLAFTASVTDREQMANAINETVTKLGHLDYAFNNAGVPQYITPFAEQTEEQYEHIMGINTRGTWLCMQLEAAHMIKAGKGSIVNTASQAGLVGLKQLAIYTASTHAVIGMTKAAAIEYADQGIRVNAVCPGVVNGTDMFDNAERDAPGLVPFLTANIPMKRLGTTTEMAEAVYYLMVHGEYMTGQALMLDGGTNL